MLPETRQPRRPTSAPRPTVRRSRRQRLESCLALLALTFGASILPFLILQRTVPWFGQHLGMIAAALAACSLYTLWQLSRTPAGRRARGRAGGYELSRLIPRVGAVPLLGFGAVYLGFGVVGLSSIRWVHALPSESALVAVSGTVTRITMCDSSAHGRYAAIDLTTAAGTVASAVVPKIDFLQCPGARDRLAKLKPGDPATVWLGRYPTDEETGTFVWALTGPNQTIISLDEMHAAHQRHFRKFKLCGGIVATLGVLMILFSLTRAYRPIVPGALGSDRARST